MKLEDFSMDYFSRDPFRGLVAIEGEDRRTFLQGLISNDTAKLSETRALYSAFLTPQGKFLHDFCIVERQAPEGPQALLDPEAGRLADLVKRLSMYRLRSKVKIQAPGEGWSVVNFFGPGALARLGLGAEPGAAKALGGGVVFTDPRLAALGARAFLPATEVESLAAAAGFTAAPEGAFERLRISLGVPDGSRELTPEKAILLENGFDELHGVDWQKGCYMGQELTARTRYRGLVRKRLLPVSITGPAPAPGTPLLLGEVEAGELRSIGSDGTTGLAMIRIENLDRARSEGLAAGGARVVATVPDWVKLPEPAQ
jgi:folate-binding protein YgfZ